ncbi:MAG: hypothetical protein HY046_12050 [Acidobacteria bacterium]|nr:hypothetical protein [Acidobacteriota bacterium]
MRIRFVFATLILLLGSEQLLAQAPPPTVPRFDLPDSGLEWRELTHPQKFFDVTGRRSAVFGKQTGQFEAWVYPIKVLHGFRLEFKQDGMPEPVRGENYLEQIVARPESTTFVYSHPLFTVREIIWTPLYEPAIVIFFEVDSPKPLTITAKFVPDFKPMWPASLGGQYSYWINEEKAFGLTDATSKPTAVIGSPQVGAYTEHMDHALVGGEMLLSVRVSAEDARQTFPAIAISMDMESAEKARAIYRDVLTRARELFEARVKYHRDFLARTLQIETPDAELNRAFVWAKVAIDAGWVCTPTKATQGCGIVAGYGPSGDSERPGFAWWFGGDAMMASWAMLDYGDTEGALQVLRFVKHLQRADGKIAHEVTQSVDLVDWFGKYGFAYYHADTTPMYIYSVGQYWRRTGDKKFLEEFWPSVKKAYEYCLSTVDPADGLMDNTKAGLAAVEVGPLRGKVVKDIYLEGFWLAAIETIESLGRSSAINEYQDQSFALSQETAKSIQNHWWDKVGRRLGFGLDAKGNLVDRHGNWSAVLLSLTSAGFSWEDHVSAVQALGSPELATDWGVRWLSNKDPLYDPVSYNNGSAWPFMTGFVALSQFGANNSVAGYQTLSSIARLTGRMSPGSMPELMNGDFNLPGERSVPHQLFSSVGVISPIIRGLLGLDASQGPEGTWTRVSTWPHLPPNWTTTKFAMNSPSGRILRTKGEIRQEKGRTVVLLQSVDGTSFSGILGTRLATGGRPNQVLLNGKRPDDFHSTNYGEGGVVVEFDSIPTAELSVNCEGGASIIPPNCDVQPGTRTKCLRVFGLDYDPIKHPRDLGVTVAGMGGHEYNLDLVSSEFKLIIEGATLEKTAAGYRLHIKFEGPGDEYVTRQIKLRW